MTSPKSLLRCGDSSRQRVPPGVLSFSAHPFVRASLARADRRIGGRAGDRRDRTVAIGRISYGGLIIMAINGTCELRRGGLLLCSTWALVGWRLGDRQRRRRSAFRPTAPPTVSGAARERSVALVEARFRSMTRAPERRQPQCQCQKRRQLSLDAPYAAAGVLTQEAGLAGPRSYLTDKVLH